MDQSELRQWEERCIQDQPPKCTAACPLHVDVRGFIGRIQAGRWSEAVHILRKTMPLPDLLGRICDAPCETRCIRSQCGDAIRIGALERACVRSHPSPMSVPAMPARNKAVAVVGTGLSSLTAAWDLIRKGYAITLMEPEPQPGAELVQQHRAFLSPGLVQGQIDGLKTLGVQLQTNVSIDHEGFPGDLLKTFQAVYIGLDSVQPAAVWPPESRRIETRLQQTGMAGIFAGGTPPSAVWQAAQGRWAATTIDRFLQKVSLTAGREKEGPLDSRLFTSMEGVAQVPAVGMTDPAAGYSIEEAKREADRCLQCQCLECVKSCAYLETFGAYPRKYAREIYNNASLVMGARTANKLINSCSLCGLCETVCPEDFAMQDLCLQARQAMVQKGKMPPSAHEFALLDMEFSRSERFSLARSAPGTDHCRYALFPGCQLCAADPDKIKPLYDHLRSVQQGDVGLILGCCGAPAHWAGRQSLYREVCDALTRQWQDMGRPHLIAACSTCYQMFRRNLPEIAVQSVWPILAHSPLPSAAGNGFSSPVAVHDPCTTRHEPHIQNAVRHILHRLGIAYEELSPGGEKTECCGFGGLMSNAAPDLAMEVVRRRSRLSSHDYLTYCAMCRDSMAALDKRTLHLLDLLFSSAAPADPAGRKRTGWSRRRDNRSRLKNDLLAEVWNEAPAAIAGRQSFELHISPEVGDVLESRRILVEDLQQVIQHAEAGGRRLRHVESKHFKAAWRSGHVTFWVEYAPLRGGYEIYNAYAHRMEVSFP